MVKLLHSLDTLLESSLAHAHVVVGDAHDFYLRDPSNVAKFVGTVSLQPKVSTSKSC